MTPIIRSAARDDILRQYGWYLDNAGIAVAERFLNAVQASIDTVTGQPGIGAPRFLANPLLAGLRSWPVKGFAALRIYYLVQPEHMIVVRILHGQRDVAPFSRISLPTSPIDPGSRTAIVAGTTRPDFQRLIFARSACMSRASATRHPWRQSGRNGRRSAVLLF